MSEQSSLTEYGVEPQYDSIINNKTALRDLFVRRGKSSYKIAKIADVPVGKVQGRLRKFGIYRDSQLCLDKQRLRELFVNDGLKKDEIAAELDSNYNTVDRHLRYYGLDDEISSFERHIKRRSRDNEVISFRTLGEYSSGAYEIWDPNKSDCEPASQVLHHRLLAVAEYGFEAVVDKQVHHKNGIPWDNRPDNIEPISQRDHIRKHWHPNDVYQTVVDADRGQLVRALETAGYKSAAEAIKRQAQASAEEIQPGESA